MWIWLPSTRMKWIRPLPMMATSGTEAVVEYTKV